VKKTRKLDALRKLFQAMRQWRIHTRRLGVSSVRGAKISSLV